MSKQDGYASRTAADLERKYNFGQTFAEVYGLVETAQQTADDAKEAIEGLDQEAIFNLLTNFGAAQGVYRDENGNVYVNASYIKSGKLAAEFIDAQNLKVAAANITGELVATQIDTKDLKVLAANITGTLTAGQIDATNLEVSAANITGTLKASQIDATNLKVKAANIEGTITASQIDATNLTVKAANISGTLTASQINTSSLTISGAQVTGTLSSANISASNITSGTLNANNISLGGSYGGFTAGRGSGGSGMTYGAMMYGSDPDYYVIVTNGGVRLQTYGRQFFVSDDTIYASQPIQEGSSDRRTKNSISYEMDKYEQFFHDLKPCFFRYNANSDGRINLGFIAQDVQDALERYGMGWDDFAGLGWADVKDENGEYHKRYTLGLKQFVALNTYMIQKLYQRLEVAA